MVLLVIIYLKTLKKDKIQFTEQAGEKNLELLDQLKQYILTFKTLKIYLF